MNSHASSINFHFLTSRSKSIHFSIKFMFCEISSIVILADLHYVCSEDLYS